MNPIENQLVDSSRFIADAVVSNIGNNQELFDEAVALLLRDEYPISMRAARIVQLSAQKYPLLLEPHFLKFIEIIPRAKVDGVRRSLLAFFVETHLPEDEDQLGLLTDICFSFASDHNEAIAVRAYAVDILLKVIVRYPELKHELVEVLEKSIPLASPGLGGRFKKIHTSLLEGKTKKFY